MTDNPYLKARVSNPTRVASPNPYLNQRKQAIQISSKQPFVSGSVLSPTLSPEAAQLQKKRQSEIGQTAFGAFEGATAGIPREIISRTTGLNIPRGNVLGQIGGSLLPISKIGKVVSKIPALVGRGALKAVGRGALTGAAGSQVFAPEEFTDIKTRGGRALGGAAVGAVAEPLAAGIGNIGTSLRPSKFLKSTRRQFIRSFGSKKAEFRKGLDELVSKNPGKVVNFDDSISLLQSQRQYNPELDRLIKQTPGLNRILNNSQFGRGFNARGAQDLINQFQSKLPRRILAKIDIRPDERDLVNAVETLRLDLAKSFPEIRKLRTSYAQTLKDIRTIRPSLTASALEPKLRRGFGTEPSEAVERLIGKEGLKRLKGFKQASDVIKIVANPFTAGGLGVTGGLIYAGSKLRELAGSNRRLSGQ